jgi:hypothetical protein
MATHLVQQLTSAEQVDNTLQDNAYNTLLIATYTSFVK